MPAHMWPKPFNHLESGKRFLIRLCIILTLLLAVLFFAIYSRTDRMIVQRLRQQAIDYIDLLNHVKTWNFNYGGVYVEKRPGVESNIYLKKQGINPDVKTVDGRTFTVRNHAIMTTEISRISERHDGITFRIVSLKPLDPDNMPDHFEKQALHAFDRGVAEAHTIERFEGKPARYRYLTPLYVDKTCLECHFNQGYSVGDVIGAISVQLPAEPLLQEQKLNRILIIIVGLLSIGAVVGICYFLTWRLVKKLDETQRHLKMQATTDELTGLKNRRRIMSRLDEEYQRSCRLEEPLSLIIVDIDHFKRINDNLGHPFGDLVLKQVATRMKEILRKYDIIGRIGGEEFLIIAPGTDRDEAIILAERLRETIGLEPISDGKNEVDVTVSAGVAIVDALDDTIESLLKRADNALYKAKRGGRNRVESL